MEGVDLFMGVIAPYINFAIFLFLAVKLFKAPLSNMITQRKSDFEALVAEANRAKQEALAQKQQLETRLAGLDAEINSMIEASKKTAEAESTLIINKAKSLAEQIKTESERLAEAKLRRATVQLQTEVIQQVTQQVKAQLTENLDSVMHQAMIDQKVAYLSKMEREA